MKHPAKSDYFISMSGCFVCWADIGLWLIRQVSPLTASCISAHFIQCQSPGGQSALPRWRDYQYRAIRYHVMSFRRLCSTVRPPKHNRVTPDGLQIIAVSGDCVDVVNRLSSQRYLEETGYPEGLSTQILRLTKVLGPKIHTPNGFGTFPYYYLGTWTLRVADPRRLMNLLHTVDTFRFFDKWLISTRHSLLKYNLHRLIITHIFLPMPACLYLSSFTCPHKTLNPKPKYLAIK